MQCTFKNPILNTIQSDILPFILSEIFLTENTFSLFIEIDG